MDTSPGTAGQAVSDTTAGGRSAYDPFPGRPSLPQAGMMVFLASDLMLFAGFFAAYFLLRSTATTWPPPGVNLDIRYTAITTVLLIGSSGTLQMGLTAFERRQDVRALRRWTTVTIVLGAIFLANQIREFLTIDFFPSSHAYGSTYWFLTGFHAAHVTAGLVALGVILARTTASTFDGRDAPAATAIGYFWHFVDAVWVAVFATLYLVR